MKDLFMSHFFIQPAPVLLRKNHCSKNRPVIKLCHLFIIAAWFNALFIIKITESKRIRNLITKKTKPYEKNY